MGHLFSGELPNWNIIFHHYRKWSVKEEWERVYSNILRKNREVPKFSISHIDSSHTPAYCGGEKTGYQGRKKRCTAYALFLSDNQEIPSRCPSHRAGTMLISMR